MTLVSDTSTSTMVTVSTGLCPDEVPAAVRRAAVHVGRRWYEPRLSEATYGRASASFRIARPMEWPTVVRLTWQPGQGSETVVRVSVRHAAGLSSGARRMLERFVDVLGAELGVPAAMPHRTAS